MATAGQWIAGARPRTLPAAVVPVAVGVGVAANIGSPLAAPSFAVRAGLALLVALGLQVGANYANDYSDGIRGTDEQRLGPVRLVGQHLAQPGAVKSAAFAAFAVAGASGLALTVLTAAWWLLAVGAAAIVAAWLYTGGAKPYGYSGLGELMVFLFFGVVAVAGTTFVCTGRLSWLAVIVSIPVGLLACALLVINNLRDIPTDTIAGKRTLAVRLGDSATRRLYCAVIAAAFVIVAGVGVVGLFAPQTAPPGALAALVTGPLAIRPVHRVRAGAAGRDLIGVLGDTGLLQLAFGLVLAISVAVAVN